MKQSSLALLFALAFLSSAHAQTMSFEEAANVILRDCGKYIEKHCSKVNLGSGKMRDCLMNNPSVSGACKAGFDRVTREVQKRAQARVDVLKVCDADVHRLCGLIQKGDGNLLECMLTAHKAVSPKCDQAITDAGYRQ